MSGSKNSFIIDSLDPHDPELIKLVELKKIKDEIAKQKRIAKEKDFKTKYPAIAKLQEKVKGLEPAKEPEPVKEAPKQPEPQPEPPKEPEPQPEPPKETYYSKHKTDIPIYHPQKSGDLKPGVVNVIRATPDGKWF
jgi:hypothetical protein